MSIMFLEGTYPSPGEVHEGRLQLVEVSLHTQVCTDLGARMLLEGQDWHVDSGASCFELSVLGAACCSRTGCEEPGQRETCQRQDWMFWCLCFLPVSSGLLPLG